MSEYIQVLSTIDEEEKAKEITKKLLEQRVASCVQIFGPVTSSYWWKGRIEQAQEWMCLAKGKAEDYKKIEATIKSIHPYEVPEIVAIPISYGNIDYLQWIRSETTKRRMSNHRE